MVAWVCLWHAHTIERSNAIMEKQLHQVLIAGGNRALLAAQEISEDDTVIYCGIWNKQSMTAIPLDILVSPADFLHRM